MSKKIVLASLLALFASGAQAAIVWQPAPPAKNTQAALGPHAGHGAHSGGKAFVLQGGSSSDMLTEAVLWMPTGVRRPLSFLAGGRVSVKGTGLNGYHMLLAKKQQGPNEEVAMRYLSMRGKPSGVSPSELLNTPKATLDITPAPLTREHQRYLSQKPVTFMIRYNGEPIAGQPVTLSTSNGSESSGTSDADGRITLSLPDDFSDVEPGRANNKPADFVVATAHEAGGRKYHTTFSAPYYVNPSHWRSTTGGLAAVFAGALTGFVVLRRSRKGNDKAGRV